MVPAPGDFSAETVGFLLGELFPGVLRVAMVVPFVEHLAPYHFAVALKLPGPGVADHTVGDNDRGQISDHQRPACHDLSFSVLKHCDSSFFLAWPYHYFFVGHPDFPSAFFAKARFVCCGYSVCFAARADLHDFVLWGSYLVPWTKCHGVTASFFHGVSFPLTIT
jgi:hypothetical protein